MFAFLFVFLMFLYILNLMDYIFLSFLIPVSIFQNHSVHKILNFQYLLFFLAYLYITVLIRGVYYIFLPHLYILQMLFHNISFFLYITIFLYGFLRNRKPTIYHTIPFYISNVKMKYKINIFFIVFII